MVVPTVLAMTARRRCARCSDSDNWLICTSVAAIVSPSPTYLFVGRSYTRRRVWQTSLAAMSRNGVPDRHQLAWPRNGCSTRRAGCPRRDWCRSARRFDVRVEAEEIVGVVRLLQRRQPLIISAVGCGDALLVVLAEVVDVDAAGEGLQCAPAVAGPPDILGGVRR